MSAKAGMVTENFFKSKNIILVNPNIIKPLAREKKLKQWGYTQNLNHYISLMSYRASLIIRLDQKGNLYTIKCTDSRTGKVLLDQKNIKGVLLKNILLNISKYFQNNFTKKIKIIDEKKV